MAASWRKLFPISTQIPRIFSHFSSVFLPRYIPVQYHRYFSYTVRSASCHRLSRVHYKVLNHSECGTFTGNQIIKQLGYHTLCRNNVLKPALHIRAPNKSITRALPTLNQIMRGKRRTKKRKLKTMRVKEREKILHGPQRKGVCVKVFIRKPKKPNSANRKCALLRLNNGQTIIAYIPGEKASLQEHGVVLFEGGRVQDCPGVRYKIIRGKYDVN